MNNKKLANNIVTLIMMTLILKGMGFVNRIIIAYFFGTTSETDIYYTASGFVDSIASILIASLTIGIINVYITSKGDKNIFVTNLAIISTILMMTIGIVIVIGSTNVSNVLAPAYDNDERLQLEKILRVMTISFPFQGIIAVLSAVLQAEKRFMPVKLLGSITSIINIFCLILFAKKIGTNSLIVSYVIGVITNALFLIFNSRKYIKLKKFKCIINDDIRKLFVLIIPVAIGTAAHEINLIADKSIASNITNGAISALSYSCVLYLFVENIINNSIVTAAFPEIMEIKKQGGHNEVASITKKVICLAESLLIPIVLCMFATAEDITKIVYMRGSFDEKSSLLTYQALKGYVLGLPFLAFKDVLTRVFYSYDDTRIPVFINLCGVTINILLDIFLSSMWGIFGIAISTSISNLFTSILLFNFIKKYNGYIKMSEYKKDFIIFILIVLLSLPVIIFFKKVISLSGLVLIVVLGLLLFAINYILQKYFKTEFYQTISKLFYKFFIKRGHAK